MRAAAPFDPARLAGPAVLVLVPLVLFHDAVFEGRVFYYRDVHLQWVGQMEALVRGLAAGSWPLWNPYASFGQPLLANANYQVLYPPTWLNLLMAPWTYYTVFVVGHFVISAAGLFAFVRRLGLSSLAATLGAALWVASGPFVSLVSLWNHLAGAAWIPWSAWAAETALAGGRWWTAVLWGALLAAPVLAGSPESALMAGLVSAVVALRHIPRWRRTVAFTLAALAVGAGLSAAQWVPSVELAARSVRGLLTDEQRTLWSLHPVTLLLTACPALLDAMPLRTDVRALLFDAREPYLPSLYLGLPAAAMVAAGLTSRRRLTWTLAAMGVLAALVAVGRHGPVYEAALTVFPPLRALRFPAKALLVAALAFSVVAAAGFEAWSAAAPKTAARRVGDVALVVGAAMGLGAALVVWVGRDEVGSVLLEPLYTRRSFAALIAPLATAVAAAGAAAAAVALLSLARARLPP
ncbi:MAG TPA: hypothetical protein VMR21_06340, partial [Vicinamibacteria bacterium]|nr:hypothetical protein [Vicinamibacteria bacterium]